MFDKDVLKVLTGMLGTITLGQVNDIIGIIVGLVTLVFLSLKIREQIRNW